MQPPAPPLASYLGKQAEYELLVGEHHGRPVFKLVTAIEANVWLLFWDERDGPDQAGWWFCNDDNDLAHNPALTLTPPSLSGWRMTAATGMPGPALLLIAEAAVPVQDQPLGEPPHAEADQPPAPGHRWRCRRGGDAAALADSDCAHGERCWRRYRRISDAPIAAYACVKQDRVNN